MTTATYAQKCHKCSILVLLPGPAKEFNNVFINVSYGALLMYHTVMLLNYLDCYLFLSDTSSVLPRSSPYQRNPSLNNEIKTLAEMYKQKKGMDGSKVMKSKSDTNFENFTFHVDIIFRKIILGAMIYNGSKGVKRKEFLPNPTMAKCSTLNDVFTKANEIYFCLDADDFSFLCLADLWNES